MPPPVHEHARRTKTKLGNHHIGLYRRVFERKNPYGVFKFDKLEIELIGERLISEQLIKTMALSK
jgi:hypothetical protein